MIRYYVDGVGHTPIKEQALEAAHIRAKQTGMSVEVAQERPDGKWHSVLVYPDGTMEKTWKELK